MCMTLCCDHHINNLHFFSQFVLFVALGMKHLDTGYLVVSCQCNSSYSFSQVIGNFAGVLLRPVAVHGILL